VQERAGSELEVVVGAARGNWCGVCRSDGVGWRGGWVAGYEIVRCVSS